MAVPSIPGKTVEVPDIPFMDSVSLPTSNSALVVVDMQNDFVKEGGALLVEAASETIGHIQRLLSAARQGGMPVAFTQDTHFENDPEFDIWPEHCRAGSWGWEIVDELKPEGEELICRKNRYDGFYGSWLEHFLSNIWDVENVIIVGTVSNICVLHTAASAGLRWYNVVVPANGVSALTEFDQALTLRQVSTLYSGQVTRRVDDIEFV